MWFIAPLNASLSHVSSEKGIFYTTDMLISAINENGEILALEKRSPAFAHARSLL